MIFQFNENWEQHLPTADTFICNKHSKHKEVYYNLSCGFDIETTQIINGDTKHAYMYVWQAVIENVLVIGRTWDDFFRYLDIVIEHYSSNDGMLLFWIHNIAFEASYMLTRMCKNITKSFYKDKRKPIFFEYRNKIRFQDSLALTGCSLEQTAKIYNLDTRKAVGCLDYKLIRNSKTKLTAAELVYICNDVFVLRDFGRKVIDEIIPKNYDKLPLTKTQLFLNKVFHYMSRNEKLKCHDMLLTFDEYITANRYLFRGGYVHANAYWIGQVLNNVQSVDFTSSYPAVMLHDYVPISKFRSVDINILSMELLRRLLDNYCCWLDISFYNIRTTTDHTIESRSKIVRMASDSVFDNGRLYSSSYVNVQLTELDFDVYEHFYRWDQIQINSIKIARRGKLPAGLLKALKEDYIIKAKLKKEDKKDTIDYILAKQNINSAYGACCKKIPFNEWSFTTEWTILNNNQSERDVYLKWQDKTNILPFQFACWITSHARHHLLVEGVYSIGRDCVYMDTDSMKVVNYDKHRQVVVDYNNKMLKANEELLKESDYFNDLGEFDENDGFYEEFKTLGCKRYVVKEDNEAHATIAGLPKKALINECNRTNRDIMDLFCDNMVLNQDASLKLTTHYNDDIHTDLVTDYQGNTEVMTELSSCVLYEIPFNMSLTREYMDFLIKVLNINKNYIC